LPRNYDHYDHDHYDHDDDSAASQYDDDHHDYDSASGYYDHHHDSCVSQSGGLLSGTRHRRPSHSVRRCEPGMVASARQANGIRQLWQTLSDGSFFVFGCTERLVHRQPAPNTRLPQEFGVDLVTARLGQQLECSNHRFFFAGACTRASGPRHHLLHALFLLLGATRGHDDRLVVRYNFHDPGNIGDDNHNDDDSAAGDHDHDSGTVSDDQHR
jgi:hypothetical protein